MAIAAATVTQGGLPYSIVGAERRTVTDITMDNSYPTGGEAVTAAQLGLNSVRSATANIRTSTSSGVNMAEAIPLVQSDGSVLLKVMDETPAEVTNTGDLTAAVIRVTAQGV